jgi:exodeoxyribonuclease VII small subunit
MQRSGGSSEMRFEEGMAALESLVSRLESGDLPLEEALGLFEQGVRFVRALQDKLNEAERRIEVLSRAEDGSLVTRQLDEGEW